MSEPNVQYLLGVWCLIKVEQEKDTAVLQCSVVVQCFNAVLQCSVVVQCCSAVSQCSVVVQCCSAVL